jgi:hypothetical protein
MSYSTDMLSTHRRDDSVVSHWLTNRGRRPITGKTEDDALVFRLGALLMACLLAGAQSCGLSLAEPIKATLQR